MNETFRKHFGYDTEAASNEVCVKDFGPSLTVQSQSEDADINVIMERFGLTGKFPENPKVPTYIDYEDIFDYRTALTRLQDAQTAFMAYPAKFRAQFENDPQQFLEFCHNENNRDEMIRLGLIKPTENPNVPQPDAQPNSPPRSNPGTTGGGSSPNPGTTGGGTGNPAPNAA
ncbi:MAG: internal scaffolding protein [Microvirus sp.]|nr:MAG: internal scaffolding protein [Microvirus sp.]